MKKLNFYLTLGVLIISGAIYYSCQREDDLIEPTRIEQEVLILKSESNKKNKDYKLPPKKVAEWRDGNRKPLQKWVDKSFKELEKQCRKAENCSDKIIPLNNLFYIQNQLDVLGANDVECGAALCDGFLDDSNTYIDVTPAELHLQIGQTTTLHGQVIVGNGTCDGEIEWGTTDHDVISVDKLSGEITAVGKGFGGVIGIVKDAINIKGVAQVFVEEEAPVDIVLVAQSTGWTAPWMGYEEFTGLRDIGEDVIDALNQTFDSYQFSLVLYGSEPSIADCAADLYWYDGYAPYLEPQPYYDWIPLTNYPFDIIDGLSSIQLICELPLVWGDSGVTPYSALLHSINNTDWRPESEKIIILFQLSPVDALHPENAVELVSALNVWDVIEEAVNSQVSIFTWQGDNYNGVEDPLMLMALNTNGEFYKNPWPVLDALETIFNDISAKISTQ